MPGARSRRAGRSSSAKSDLQFIILPSVLLFIAACLLPAYQMVEIKSQEPDTLSGLTCLLFGWAGFFMRQIAWLANVLLGVAWLAIRVRSYVTAICMLLIGTLIACHAFTFLGNVVWADEAAARRLRAVAFGVGLYLWLASFLVPLFPLIWRVKYGDSNREQPSRISG